MRDAAAFDLVAAHPFATLITPAVAEPLITHCPITAQAAHGSTVLEGHVARANQNWHAWRDGATSVLAVFHGPNAYVSPSLYTGRQNVPTWNYAVVHVAGDLSLVDGEDDKHALLKRLIARIEPGYAAQWDELDQDYKRRMLGAIVGFRIAIGRIDAKFKLGQNRIAADRDNVRAAFATGTAPERALAEWFDRLVSR
ncbi:MAG: FMN-binding negative transcriptional regulator [Burkholderiaceae bacterium]|nr:FMN-binding negative transcriptional regulator [Burkholderiaceae bacterium]